MADVVKFIILCHNRGAKGTQRPFPHESCIPTKPWETASRPADWMELGCFGLCTYTQQKYKQAYKWRLWRVYLSCTWFDWTSFGDKMCCLDCLSQRTAVICYFFFFSGVGTIWFVLCCKMSHWWQSCKLKTIYWVSFFFLLALEGNLKTNLKLLFCVITSNLKPVANGN